jgi:hypothetical protein
MAIMHYGLYKCDLGHNVSRVGHITWSPGPASEFPRNPSQALPFTKHTHDDVHNMAGKQGPFKRCQMPAPEVVNQLI